MVSNWILHKNTSFTTPGWTPLYFPPHADSPPTPKHAYVYLSPSSMLTSHPQTLSPPTQSTLTPYSQPCSPPTSKHAHLPPLTTLTSHPQPCSILLPPMLASHPQACSPPTVALTENGIVMLPVSQVRNMVSFYRLSLLLVPCVQLKPKLSDLNIPGE